MNVVFFTNNKTLFFVLVFLTCCFAACERDIELELPEQKKLVLLSNFTPDRQFKVRLSSTHTLGNENTNSYPKSAIIQLFEDGNYIQNFVFQRESTDTIPYYSMHYTPIQGRNYQIIAEVNGFPTATASDILPPKLPIALGINAIDSIQQDFSNEYSIELGIQLPPPTENHDYFHLSLQKDVHYVYTNSVNDTIVETFQDPVFFNISDGVEQLEILHEPGILVDRQALTNPDAINLDLSFYFDPQNERKGKIQVSLKNVSEAYYLFHKSVGEQEVTSGNNSSILSIPSTIIYNNIDNGIGNFSGYTTSVDSIAW